MSTTPLLYKENDGHTTPLQERCAPPAHSAGRSFGTPLSNCSTGSALNKSSLKQQRQSSSKKLVRARKLVNQHRSPPPPAPPSSEYTVTFRPGPIGMQLEPANGVFGCRVSCISDGGPERPGQARQSRRIQPGDIMIEVNDEAVFHKEYDDIISLLREMSKNTRTVRFRHTPNVPVEEFTVKAPKTTSVSFAENVSSPGGDNLDSNNLSQSKRDSSDLLEDSAPPTPQPIVNSHRTSGDVVIEVNDTSIDSTSTITPSKVKNLSQEDLELGFGSATRCQEEENDARKPIGNVLRNVYQNMVIGTVASFDFGKLGEALTGGHATSQELEESFQRKSKLLQDLNKASTLVGNDGSNDSVAQEKIEAEKAILEKQFNSVLSKLQRSQTEERARHHQLEVHLTEANARVAELTLSLREAEIESESRVREAQDEASQKIYQMSRMQHAKQTDLETKLLEAECKMETLSQQNEETRLKLEKELAEANSKVQEILKDKEEKEASLEAIRLEMEQLKSSSATEKTSHYELQVQIAKMQTELREEKKQREHLKQRLAENSEQTQQLQISLRDKQEELDGTKCMMEKYEERFVEREKELEAIQEEKEFAGRELRFARTENQKLRSRLEETDNLLSSVKAEMAEKDKNSREENQRLIETLTMTQKELGDQKQSSYDKERDIQAQLLQRIAESNKLQKELDQLKHDSSETEKSLRIALDKRDADLALLNDKFEENINTTRQELQTKDEEMVQLKQKLVMHEDNANRKTQVETEIRSQMTDLKEQLVVMKSEKEEIQKEAQELKDLANETYFEKCRITKDLQAVKAELSDAKIQHTKIQDTHLQRAKQMDNKAKDAWNMLKQKEGELSTVQEKLERANTKIETLMVENEKLEASRTEISATSKALEEERDHLARRGYQLKNEIEEKERDRLSCVEASRNAKSQLFEATNRISFLERQISELEAARNISDEKMVSMKEANCDITSKLEHIRQELENKDSHISAMTVEKLSLESTSDDLREELQQRKEELDASQQAIVAAQSQYSQLSESFQKFSDESSAKLQKLTSDLIKAQDELAESQNTSLNLERQIARSNSQLAEYEGKLTAARSELDTATAKIADLLAANKLVKEECEAKVAEGQDELEKYRQHAAKLEQECSDRSKENANLTHDLSLLEKKLASSRSLFGTEQNKHKKERKELEDQLAVQRQEASQLSNRQNSLLAELSETKKQLKDMETCDQDQIRILQESVRTKEQKVAELQQQKEEYARSLENCREELNVANFENQRIEESRSRAREEVEHLSRMIDDLRSDHLAQVESISQSHQEEIARIQKEKDELESSVRKIEEQKERLGQRLEEAQKNIFDERDRNEELILEQEGLTSNLHRAEDLVAELRCELQVLKEEHADESFDSVDSATLALSKRELRIKCKYLTEEIQEAETRAAEARSGVTQRTQHIRSLEVDMKEMSAELERMINTSEQLEKALVKARSDKAASDASAEELRSSIDLHQAKTQALKDELDQQYTENSDLLGKVRQFQLQEKEARSIVESLQRELAESQETVKKLEEQSKQANSDIEVKSHEITSLQKSQEEAESRLSDLEFQIVKLEDKLTIAEQERSRIQAESQHAEAHLKEQNRELSNECASLRSEIADLKNEVEDKEKTLKNKEEAEEALQEKLKKERAHGLKVESLREEAVTKLAEASRVLAAQKGIIKVQEARAADAESRAKKFSEQVTTLQESIQEMESKTEETGHVTYSQLEEMEKKRASLEKARQNAKAEAESLRDEVRQANRKATELERVNKSLQTRIDELKNTAETTKAQLRDARTAWTESDNLSRSLENELQNGRSEIDHLRAKLQLCGATIARLKSDRILLQEQAMKQTKSGDQDSSSIVHEFSQLKSELHTKASQLSSASASLRNYKKATAQMKQSEQQLVVFIEEIIVRADATFEQLAKLSTELQTLHQRQLSNPETPQKAIDDASCCFNRFVSLVEQASDELQGKKKKLESWKTENTHLSASTPSTKPNAESLLSPNDTSVIRAFRKMKEVVVPPSSNPQVESTIMALEDQIDALCRDLRNAHQALREKDKLFAELEMKNPIDGETSLKRLCSITEIPAEKSKTLAVRMIAKVLETNSRRDVGKALRLLSCNVASQRSFDSQKYKAEALHSQLEQTREKLIMLKAHFKKRGNDKALEILDSSSGNQS